MTTMVRQILKICVLALLLARAMTAQPASPADSRTTRAKALPVPSIQELRDLKIGAEKLKPGDIVPLKLQAKNGDAKAQYILALAYQSGEGIDQDDAQAFQWFQNSASAGYAPAQNEVGLAYKSGVGVSADLDKALAWFRKAADQGLIEAEYNLARQYEGYTKAGRDAPGLVTSLDDLLTAHDTYGNGANPNDVEANKWYLKAAEHGHTVAQKTLGTRLLLGIGGPKNIPEGAIWMRKAAEAGLPEAQYLLGTLYRGEYLAEDYAEVLKWSTKAAEQGHVKAQSALSLLLCRDSFAQKGVPQDCKRSLEWARKTAEQGDGTAQFFLAYKCLAGSGVPVDNREAMFWFRMAATHENDAKAKYMVGRMYESGAGATKNPSLAAIWFRKAAELGQADAQCRLAKAFAEGKGLEADAIEAYRWLLLSEKRGSKECADLKPKLQQSLDAAKAQEASDWVDKWIENHAH